MAFEPLRVGPSYLIGRETDNLSGENELNLYTADA